MANISYMNSEILLPIRNVTIKINKNKPFSSDEESCRSRGGLISAAKMKKIFQNEKYQWEQT